MSKITTNIDNLLADQNLSRADMCRATGLGESTIRNWIIRGTEPKYSDVLKIAYYLRTTPEYLYTGDKAFDYQTENLAGVPIERPARPERASDPLDKLRGELRQREKESQFTKSEIELISLYRNLSLSNQELVVRLLTQLSSTSR